jgi:SP family sugar porter-like MFS transporter
LLTVAWGPKRFAGVSNPNVASLVLGTLQVVLTLGAAGLMDKAGRRILLMISAGGMCLSNFLVAFSFYARSVQPEQMSPAFSTFISILALVSLLAYIASFSLGMGAIPWIIMSEIFPAYVKGVAGSVATLVNWFSAYIVTMIFNYMLLWSAAGTETCTYYHSY